MQVNLSILDESLPLPHHARLGDAGFDLYSAIDVTIAPGARQVVPCGFCLAIPQGFAGLVTPRSGLAAHHGISIVNSPGLIDSNYRGEIGAILLNTDTRESFEVHHGDRIAQLVIIQVPDVEFNVVDELDDTVRGASRFGSSGTR